MPNMELIITARSKEQSNTEYLSLREHGLSEIIEISGGNGCTKSPFQAKVKIQSENKIK